MLVSETTGSAERRFEFQATMFQKGVWFRGMISPTVATIYLFLGFTNVLVWLVQAANAGELG